MADNYFLSSLENLTGKVAIITGGSQGIGLQTTLHLAHLGATVYVCSLDGPKDCAGIASAQEELKSHPIQSTGSIHFHMLDLSAVERARKSAEEFKRRMNEAGTSRLDIIIGNAGIAFPPLDSLSADGVERTFAVNCLGHFVFLMELLDLVEQTATTYGEARITLTSSHGYKAAKKLDYKYLTTSVPNDGKSYLHLRGGMQRYLDSKLAVLYFALELDRRLRERGVENVFVNACHPGNVPRTEIGNGQQPLVGPWLASGIKAFLALFLRNSTEDAAKTQVFLSGSKSIVEGNVHGEYWAPRWSWGQKYLRSEKEELVTEMAKDRGEWKLLWEFCEETVAKSTK